MIVMIVMMYVLVDVLSAGCGCHCVLREFTFEPTHNLCHRSGLILLPRGVFQLMLLACSATLLRMNKLRVVALQVVVIVGNCLISRLLIIVGHKIDDVAVSIAAADSLLRRVVVDRRRRNHITIQYLRIRRVGLGRGMCRIVPRRQVPRFSEIRRPRFDRRFRKRYGMSALPDRFVIIHLTRLQRCMTILIIMIRIF